MEKRNCVSIVAVVIGICIMFCGCGLKPEQTGFLSDYSKLEAKSDISYRYIAPGNPVAGYSKFIIDPVVIHFHTEDEGKIKQEDLTDLTNYMHNALVEAIEDEYAIVYRPGPGVARVRIAITDLKKSGVVQNIVPIGKIAGTGIGGASMEGELIDSQTGRQLGALVESQMGKRLSLAGYSTWGDAKAVMDMWAKRFRERLDEAHGK